MKNCIKANRICGMLLTIMLAASLAGCGSSREVNIDTGVFGNGNVSSSSGGFNGTTDGGPGSSDPVSNPFGDPGSPDPESDPGGGGMSLDQMIAQGQAVQYDRAVLYDPQLNCEVARTLMPMGWKAGGEVSWSGQSAACPAIASFTITEPNEKATIGYISECAYTQPDSSTQWTPGQIIEGTLSPAKAVVSSGDYNLEILTLLFSGAKAQSTETIHPEGELAQGLESLRMELQKKADADDAQLNSYLAATGGSTRTQVIVDAAESVCTIDVNGKRYKAKLASFEIVFYIASSYSWYQTNIATWSVPLVFFYVAEESVYDEFEAAAVPLFCGNFALNQQWYSAVSQASEKIFQNESNRLVSQWQQTQQMIQQQAAAISASSQPSYSSSSGGGSSGVSSSVLDGWTNAVTDQEYFQMSDGGHAQLDSSYMHTYSDGSGFVQSNGSLNMPSGWNEVSGSTMIP